MKPILFVFLVLSASLGQPPVNPHSAILQDFDQRVTEYVKFRKTIEGKLPKLKSTPAQSKIVGHEHDLGGIIRTERRSAKQGDIFTPEIAAEFRRLVGLMQGRDTARVKESIRSAEPVSLRLGVNDAYPDKAPLQSMPPTLLQNLPKLPPEMEYRLVGRALVLRDVKANLVVDFVNDFMP